MRDAWEHGGSGRARLDVVEPCQQLRAASSARESGGGGIQDSEAAGRKRQPARFRAVEKVKRSTERGESGAARRGQCRLRDRPGCCREQSRRRTGISRRTSVRWRRRRGCRRPVSLWPSKSACSRCRACSKQPLLLQHLAEHRRGASSGAWRASTPRRAGATSRGTPAPERASSAAIACQASFAVKRDRRPGGVRPAAARRSSSSASASHERCVSSRVMTYW